MAVLLNARPQRLALRLAQAHETDTGVERGAVAADHGVVYRRNRDIFTKDHRGDVVRLGSCSIYIDIQYITRNTYPV